jgi:hypothetical protein
VPQGVNGIADAVADDANDLATARAQLIPSGSLAPSGH